MTTLVSRHSERHRAQRIGWLRAAVLGANDGLVSTASLVIGVAASKASPQAILIAGVAGLVAGAMSMAAGEYVSVQSQADTEAADLARERNELKNEPERERAELTAIYVGRGLDEPLARRVAEKLMSTDAIGAHARDELGITESLRARPLEAAVASAASFAVGAFVPIATALLSPAAWIGPVSAVTSITTLAGFGATAAYLGGASVATGATRVAFWGALAMAMTAGIGMLFGPVV